jgi:hypothetical protein
MTEAEALVDDNKKLQDETPKEDVSKAGPKVEGGDGEKESPAPDTKIGHSQPDPPSGDQDEIIEINGDEDDFGSESDWRDEDDIESIQPQSIDFVTMGMFIIGELSFSTAILRAITFHANHRC